MFLYVCIAWAGGQNCALKCSVLFCSVNINKNQTFRPFCHVIEIFFFTFLGAGSYMFINSSTGYVYLNESIAKTTYTVQSTVAVSKVAKDSSGTEALLNMTFIFNEARVFNETCPKT